MSDFKKSIASVKATLDALATHVATSKSGVKSPEEDWYLFWEELLKLRPKVDGVLLDIDRRTEAFDGLQKLTKRIPSSHVVVLPTDRIDYGAVTLEPKCARHFFTVAYLTECWTIYDSLYDVFTRLTLSGHVGVNQLPHKNKKLSDLLDLSDKDKVMLSFGMDRLFRDGLWWIYKVSYSLRNAFAHEGGRLNGADVYDSDELATFFNMSAAAKTYFDKLDSDVQWRRKSVLWPSLGTSASACTSLINASASSSTTPHSVAAALWYGDDIRVILSKYNDELDAMFSRIMVWAVNSLVGEFEVLLGRTIGCPQAQVVP